MKSAINRVPRMTKYATATIIMTLLAFSLQAACYMNANYTCRSARAGCNGSFAGGNCFLCNCWPPGTGLVTKCYYQDTTGIIVRARALGPEESGGWDDKKVVSGFCSYSHTVWDCSGTSATTTVNEPMETSTVAGTACT